MTFRSKLVVTVCLAALVPAGVTTQGAGDPHTGRAGRNEEMLCGPLCVAFLLRAFDRPADVDVIAAEADWGDGKGGATMESLVASLRRRGLEVQPTKVPAGEAFRVGVPALVHLEAKGESGGHYVIVLPSFRDAEVSLWDPGTGRATEPIAQFAGRHTGAVALVSLSAVPEAAVGPIAIAAPLARAGWMVAVASGLCGALAVAAGLARASRLSAD